MFFGYDLSLNVILFDEAALPTTAPAVGGEADLAPDFALRDLDGNEVRVERELGLLAARDVVVALDLRRRAAAKFGAAAGAMFFTRPGLEQATRAVVASIDIASAWSNISTYSSRRDASSATARSSCGSSTSAFIACQVRSASSRSAGATDTSSQVIRERLSRTSMKSSRWPR